MLATVVTQLAVPWLLVRVGRRARTACATRARRGPVRPRLGLPQLGLLAAGVAVVEATWWIAADGVGGCSGPGCSSRGPACDQSSDRRGRRDAVLLRSVEEALVVAQQDVQLLPHEQCGGEVGGVERDVPRGVLAQLTNTDALALL